MCKGIEQAVLRVRLKPRNRWLAVNTVLILIPRCMQSGGAPLDLPAAKLVERRPTFAGSPRLHCIYGYLEGGGMALMRTSHVD
jgi:hypothetical protein